MTRFVSAQYVNAPEIVQPDGSGRLVLATDENGLGWYVGENSRIEPWVAYLAESGTIDPFVVIPNDEIDLAELNRILLEEGSVMRGVMELILIEINKLRADHTRPPYTMNQFLTALQKQMRTTTP